MSRSDYLCDLCPSCAKTLWEQTKVFPEPAQRFYHAGEQVPRIPEFGDYSVELPNCGECGIELFANILSGVFIGLRSRPLFPICYSDRQRTSERAIQLRRLILLRRAEQREEVWAPPKASFFRSLLQRIFP